MWNFFNGQQLSRMEQRLTILMRTIIEELKMAQADIDKLKAKVTANTNVTQSAVALINGLAQQIRDASDDPAELQALADSLERDSAALGAAVSANTPTPA